MGIINVNIFKDLGHYKNRKNKNYPIRSIKVSLSDLQAYCISLGGYSSHTNDQIGINFYSSLTNMLLEESNNKFIIGNNYKYSESSIGTSLSFFLGMMITSLVSKRLYNIDYLYHVTDKRLELEVKNGEIANAPDFFGLSRENIPYLFEAKGSRVGVVRSDTIKNAKDQLINVKSIKLNRSGSSSKRVITTFNRHIITSQFFQKELKVNNIDPINNNPEMELSFNLDVAILNYYKHVYNLFKIVKRRKEVKIEGLKFSVIEFQNTSIAIFTPILKVLEKRDHIYNKMNETNRKNIYIDSELENFYEEINESKEQFNKLYDEKMTAKEAYDEIIGTLDETLKKLYKNHLNSDDVKFSEPASGRNVFNVFQKRVSDLYDWLINEDSKEQGKYKKIKEMEDKLSIENSLDQTVKTLNYDFKQLYAEYRVQEERKTNYLDKDITNLYKLIDELFDKLENNIQHKKTNHILSEDTNHIEIEEYLGFRDGIIIYTSNN